MEATHTGPDPVVDDHVDDDVLQISGAGHWFLEGWIGDHSVGVPRGFGIVGDSYVRLFVSDFGLCWSTGGDIGMHIKNIMPCQWDRYRGVWMFQGLLTEFPILVCDLAVGTDAIIGTDVLGSVLPHTLDIKNGYSFTAETTQFLVASSSLIIQRLSYIALYVLLGDA